jgi:hypothetical protein
MGYYYLLLKRRKGSSEWDMKLKIVSNLIDILDIGDLTILVHYVHLSGERLY